MTRTLSLAKRAKILGFLDLGWSCGKVAKHMGVSKSGVWKLGLRARTEGESVALKGKKEMCGRKKIVRKQDKEWIVKQDTRKPFSSAAQIKKAAGGRIDHLSVRRIRSTLKESGLKAHRAAKKPHLTDQMREKRKQWCANHLHWTEDDWEKVLFSDESTFQQIRSTGKFVRRPSGERFNPKFTVKTVKHPASVMVWGCFCAAGRGRLSFLEKGVTMNSVRYVDVLEEKMLPEFRARNLDWFLQDGAPCHKSKFTMSFLEDHGVPVMDWPGNSPDLNPIENMWEAMKQKIEEKQPSSLQDLINKIKHVWCLETSPEFCKKLARSMPGRLQKVLDNDGWIIGY